MNKCNGCGMIMELSIMWVIVGLRMLCLEYDFVYLLLNYNVKIEWWMIVKVVKGMILYLMMVLIFLIWWIMKKIEVIIRVKLFLN